MRLFTLFILTAFFCQPLRSQDGSNSKLKNINLSLAFSKQLEIPLSKFVENITFIPLETTPLSLIGESAGYEVTDENILVRQSRMDLKGQMLLFDKKTGMYISEIGKYGKGPGEYLTYCFVPYNRTKKTLYAINATRNILELDLSGKIVDEINTRSPKLVNKPGKKIDFSSANVSWINMIDSEIIAGYVRNNSGKEDKKIILLSKQGIIKIFPNYLAWNKQNAILGIGGHSGISQFYRWDNKLNFYENFCDTLFYVTKESLIPRYYFDWEKNKIPYSRQGELASSMSRLKESFLISQISENNYYIFIKVVHQNRDFFGFIDKNNSNVTICKPNLSGISTFKDDFYDLLDIIPYTITEENEMIFIIKPSKIIKWCEENPSKGTKLKIKYPALNNIDEFSNPIIVIGKCK